MAGLEPATAGINVVPQAFAVDDILLMQPVCQTFLELHKLFVLNEIKIFILLLAKLRAILYNGFYIQINKGLYK